jgi:ABC-2 type transport system permease protein
MARLAAVGSLQLRANLRIAVRYRADFVIGNISTMVQAVAGVVAYLFLFTALGGIGGWSPAEWTVILGLVTTARGLWSTFFIGTLDVRDLVQTGRFDSYVIRPVSSVFLVTTGRVSPDLWGETAVGVFLILFGLRASGHEFSGGDLAAVPCAVLSGVAIYYGLYLMVQVTSFWLVDNTMVAVLFERLDEYSRVPLSVFPGWMRAMFSSVLPLAFVGYLPGLVVFGRAGGWMLALTAMVAAGVVASAIGLWTLGVRRYSSAG